MAYFGEGKGPIHVDNVKCTGNERSLADCIKEDIGKHNCRHSEDAGVICDYLSKKMTTVEHKGGFCITLGFSWAWNEMNKAIVAAMFSFFILAF